MLSGTDVEDLYARQLRPPSGEIAASMGLGAIARWVLVSMSSRDDATVRARIGRMALRARTGATVGERLAAIASRLPDREWPVRAQLLVTAVAADDGSFRVFDAGSGVPLLEAVAASCAVPLVWPPVPIQGRPYVDGGVARRRPTPTWPRAPTAWSSSRRSAGRGPPAGSTVSSQPSARGCAR